MRELIEEYERGVKDLEQLIESIKCNPEREDDVKKYESMKNEMIRTIEMMSGQRRASEVKVLLFENRILERIGGVKSFEEELVERLDRELYPDLEKYEPPKLQADFGFMTDRQLEVKSLLADGHIQNEVAKMLNTKRSNVSQTSFISKTKAQKQKVLQYALVL